MSIKTVISLHSAPRSGSTWLQMLFECHPNVLTKYQPLFSHEFKDKISTHTTPQEFQDFINDVANSDNEFLNMKGNYHQDQNNTFPSVQKNNPSTLLIKNTHSHHLTETFIKLHPSIKIVYLIRHPCGVISSFLNNPRECRPEWKETDEWLTGRRKNNGSDHNYFGYNKWREITEMFYKLRTQYPRNIYIVVYEKLIDNHLFELNELFTWCGLDLHPNVITFFDESHTTTNESDTSVYKNKEVKDRWRTQLNTGIKNYIQSDIKTMTYLNGNWGEF